MHRFGFGRCVGGVLCRSGVSLGRQAGTGGWRSFVVLLSATILAISWNGSGGIGHPVAGSSLSFSDITVQAGLAGDSEGGHGMAFADATRDGLPDLYGSRNLFPNLMSDRFFVNGGAGRFSEEGAGRGIDDYDYGSHGAVWADLDNDGDYDLVNGTTYDASGNGAPNNLYRNNGNGSFVDATPSSMAARRESTRAVLAFDMDGDGDLDIFTVSGWLGSGDPAGERNEVYRNDGGWGFSAVTSGALYDAPAGQGATDTDFDGDGDVDIIAANRDGDLNVLRNDGQGNLTPVSPSSIGIVHRAYGGVTMGDVDNDGDLDLVLVGLDQSGKTVGHFYRNVGSGTFNYERSFSDINGFMAGFADLDNDGDLDLAFAGDDVVYLNDGSGHFEAGPVVPVSGISDPRAIAFADIDGDGDLDFAVSAKHSRNFLIRNDLSGGHWLKVSLSSRLGQAGAFGTKVRIYPPNQAGGQLLCMREARSSNGYLGQDDPVLHFGLGSWTAVDVEVTLLDGTRVVWTAVAADQALVVDASRTAVLSVTTSGGGTGTVTSNPAGITCGSDCRETYPQGTVVQLLATPAAGSTFGGWGGDADCSDGTVTMAGDRHCTATFSAGHMLAIGPGEVTQAGGWLEVRQGSSPILPSSLWLHLPWTAYDDKNGELHPALGDVDGDGLDEVVVGLGSGGGGWFAILDDAAHGYQLLKWVCVAWPAYDAARGEVFPALADLDGDGRAEIVAGLGPGGQGWLEVFDDRQAGFAHRAWRQVPWSAYDAADGSTHPAAADTNGDGKAEIVVGLGMGGGGWLEVMGSANSGYAHQGWVQVKWQAYDTATGATYPAAGDLDGDGKAEIVVGLAKGGDGWLEVLDDAGQGYAHRQWLQVRWQAYCSADGATHPAVGNLDNDAPAEVVVGLGYYPGQGGWLEVFDDKLRGFAPLGWLSLGWPAYQQRGGGTFPAADPVH